MAAVYTNKFRVNSVTEGSLGYAHVNLVEHDIDPTRGRSTAAVTLAVPLEESSNYQIGGLFTVSVTAVSS